MYDVDSGKRVSAERVRERYERIVGLRVPRPVGAAVSLVAMLALALVVNVFNVPNPNMILVSGLVVCSSLFGFTGGVVGALVMLAYTLFFFSTDHSLVIFTAQNLQKVVVSTIGITVVTFFVSSLRHVVNVAFGEIESLARELEEDNRLLEEASATDSLTGARNRFALRRDLPTLLDKDLHVMMLDVDNFKQANDAHGHAAGDAILNQIGHCLAEECGADHVYRYGGDEFLVICPDVREDQFVRRSEELRERIGAACEERCELPVHVSAGYVWGRPTATGDLRLMIRQADANLYSSKSGGRNRVTGNAFSRSKAEAERSAKALR